MKSIIFIYGAIVLGGGVMGYVTAGSLASLLAGILAGGALMGCVYAIAKQKVAGWYVALAITFYLDALFTKRFLKSFTLMPSGLMAAISLVVLILLAFRIRKQTVPE